MKIAITIPRQSNGGVGTSSFLLADGLRRLGHNAMVLVTGADSGPDYDRAKADQWPVEAICKGEIWLRRRLVITRERLEGCDALIDNNSPETRLVADSLPWSIRRLTVVRGSLPRDIRSALSWEHGFHELIAISPHVGHLLEQGGARRPVHVIPNAVRIYGEGMSRLATPVKICVLSRFDDFQKNLEILPAILSLLVRKGVDAQLTLAGDGRQRASLAKAFQEAGVAERVCFAGWIRREEVSDFFRAHSFAVFPSRFEGFGLTLAEAMGVGCVPIASDIPSYRWILSDLANRLCVPTDRAEAYAETLRGLAAEPGPYAALQTPLMERQRSAFTQERLVRHYLERLTPAPGIVPEAPPSICPVASLERITSQVRGTRVWHFLQRIKRRGKRKSL